MKQTKNNKFAIPMLVCAVLALVMLLTIFLPYASATEERAEKLEKYPDYYAIDELDMTGEDLINMSMVEFARMYSTMSEEMFGDSSGILYVVLVVLIAGFGIGTLICAICKKPIGAIIFDILAMLVFLVHNFDYKDRGIIPSDNYNWGVAYYIFMICAVAVFVCAVAAIALKKVDKKNTVEIE